LAKSELENSENLEKLAKSKEENSENLEKLEKLEKISIKEGQQQMDAKDSEIQNLKIELQNTKDILKKSKKKITNMKNKLPTPTTTSIINSFKLLLVNESQNNSQIQLELKKEYEHIRFCIDTLIDNDPAPPTYIPPPPPTDEATEEQLQELKKSLSQLMDPNIEVDLEHVLELKDIFKYDTGRRSFAQMLYKDYIKPNSKNHIKLDGNSFEGLLFLINAMLAILDMRNGADYICGKIILEVSKKIFHEVLKDVDGKEQMVKETVEDMIKTHYIFEDVRFWEEYFWDTISHKFQKKIRRRIWGRLFQKTKRMAQKTTY